MTVSKSGIDAALGVSEVWRYDGERLPFYVLQAEGYVEIQESSVLPSLLSASQLSHFLTVGMPFK
jgi:Uma2 family endonuclease